MPGLQRAVAAIMICLTGQRSEAFAVDPAYWPQHFSVLVKGLGWMTPIDRMFEPHFSKARIFGSILCICLMLLATEERI